MRRIKARVSPAMVVAILALVAAVTGVAFAGGKGKPITKKKANAIATRVADQRIAAAAPNLTVKSAGSAESAGTAGSAGSLRMFGHVSDTGALDNASGIGFATFATNVYCLGGLAASPRGGEVTADGNEAGIYDFPQLGLGTTSGCPAGTQVYVLITNNNTGTFTDSGFFIELWS
jgi:hypothetical protein